jgi:hypothetical protein
LIGSHFCQKSSIENEGSRYHQHLQLWISPLKRSAPTMPSTSGSGLGRVPVPRSARRSANGSTLLASLVQHADKSGRSDRARAKLREPVGRERIGRQAAGCSR